MALFLAVLGGAAVVEVHRAITGGGNKDRDLQLLKQREELLRRQLQEIQKELEAAKSERELTEQEASQLSLVNEQLRLDAKQLQHEAQNLRNENHELSIRADQLLERQQLLEQCAESLKLENGILLQQFERLKVKHEEETAALEEQIRSLKEQVTTVLQSFTEGKTTASELIESLNDIGVELRLPEQELAAVPERLAAATTNEERVEILESAELKVDASWIQQMKLVASSPTRAARLVGMAASNNRGQNSLLGAVTPRALQETSLKLESHAILPAETPEAIESVPTPQSQERDEMIPAKIHLVEHQEAEVSSGPSEEGKGTETKHSKSSFGLYKFMNRKKQNAQEFLQAEESLLALRLGEREETEDVQPMGKSMVAL